MLKQHLNVQISIISGGGFRHEGQGPPYLFECFMEVCSILLFVGDVFGYITVDADGVVDPLRSHAPFIERFVLCLEIMHWWCMRHPPKGQTPKDRRWLTSGAHRKVLNSTAPLLRLRMVNAVYPHVTEDTLIPDGVMVLPDFKLRGLFLKTSKSVIDLAEEGCYGECEPLRFSQDIQGVELFLSARRVKTAGAETELTRFYGSQCKEEQVIGLCLAASCDPLELCEQSSPCDVRAGWELYWSFEAYAPNESLCDGIKSLLIAEGIQV